MKFIIGAFLSVLLLSPAFSAERIKFKNYGFSIEELPAAESEKGDVFQNAIIFLPSKDKSFTPNVNVQEQKLINITQDEYIMMSDSSFEEAGAQIIEKKPEGKNTMVYEYTFEMNGVSLHVYSKVFFAQNKAYLASATSLVSQWEEVGESLKKNVNSFKLLK